MEIDVTIIFCELYFNLINKNIELILLNNKKLVGHIDAYYYEDIDAENKKISMWHFVERNIDKVLGDSYEELNFSKLIPHKLIKTIKYIDNFSKPQQIQF